MPFLRSVSCQLVFLRVVGIASVSGRIPPFLKACKTFGKGIHTTKFMAGRRTSDPPGTDPPSKRRSNLATGRRSEGQIEQESVRPTDRRTDWTSVAGATTPKPRLSG